MTTADSLVDRSSHPSRTAHVPRYLRAKVPLAIAAFLGLCAAQPGLEAFPGGAGPTAGRGPVWRDRRHPPARE